ncbi:MAG: glycerophosphodiester phosphodiesterase family protein [Christensenellales bacterium]|jgi:glycerophosphoryl diester phosphodiesterase
MDIFDSWLVNTYIAHRGFHDKKNPENSMGAFENAIKKGFAIELDVHALKDNTIVVFHDESLKRMTNQDGYISNLTKEDLPNYKLLATEFSIPTLEEVFALVNGQVPILIEVKNTSKVGVLEQEILRLVNNYKGEVAIQAFNPLTLNFFYNNAPLIWRGQLSGSFEDADVSRIKKYLLKRMIFNKKISKPNFISYEAKMLPNRFVKKFNNLPLLAWCVKSQTEYLNLAGKCDNIIFENFEPKI